MRKREEAIKEKKQFLENEIENNKEQEKKISIAERISARTRIDYQEAETQRMQFSDEVDLQIEIFILIALIFVFHKYFIIDYNNYIITYVLDPKTNIVENVS